MSKVAVLLLGISLLFSVGCGGMGGMSQEEMKRRAIQRKKDDSSTPDATARATSSNDTPPAAQDAGRSSDNSDNNIAATGDKPADTAADRSAVADATAAFLVTPVAPPAEPLGNVERRARTIANLERIAAALEKHMEDKGAYPGGSIHFDKRPLLSWRVALLPYLGYEDLYKQFHLNEPWDSPHNFKLLPFVPEPYQSPERFDEKTNYLAVVGSAFAFDRTRGRMRSQFEDGIINTALVLEVDDPHAVPWTAPQDFEPPPTNLLKGLGTLREDGFFMIWGGGTVGRVARDANARQLYAMFSIEGGESFLYSDLHQQALADVAVPAAQQPALDPNRPDTKKVAHQALDHVGAGVGNNSSGPTATPQWNPPEEATSREVLERLREIYAPQLASARHRAARVKIADQMLTHADSLKEDTTTRFVLLHVVIEVAAECGYLPPIEKALSALEGEYAFDAFPRRVAALQQLAKHKVDDPAALITAALDAARRAMNRDDYKAARAMHGLAASLTREVKEHSQSAQIAQVKRALDRGERDYREVVRAVAKLEITPEDPDANTVVGKYYCLVKNDWHRGTPFLVKSGDKMLSAAALAETQLPSLPSEYIAAGDAWWSYGQSERDDRRAACQRAVYWYLLGLEHGNSDLAGIKAEVRVKQAEQSFGSEFVAALRSSLRGGRRGEGDE